MYENQISRKYLKLLNFDKINSTIAISPKDQLILVTKLELIGSDTSTIEGLYKNKEFAGSANIKKINLQLLDKILLKINRIEGYLNLDISSNGLIDINTIQNISGSIDGEVNIKIENSEIALLNFLQSLTANVEDLEAFNTFSEILTKSFVNRTIKYWPFSKAITSLCIRCSTLQPTPVMNSNVLKVGLIRRIDIPISIQFFLSLVLVL